MIITDFLFHIFHNNILNINEIISTNITIFAYISLSFIPKSVGNFLNCFSCTETRADFSLSII